MHPARKVGSSILAGALALGALALAAPPARAAPGEPNKHMQEVLDELGKLGGRPIETLSAVAARKQPTPADAVKKLLQDQGESPAPEVVAKVAEQEVQGAEGLIPARVYWPKTSAKGPLPLLLYFHGGGWVIATNDTYDASARALANGAEAIVVAVEYRKAPEFKFPAAHEDAFASYKWALDHAADLGADPHRIAVAGESAGGNLAANVSLSARDAGLPLPLFQVLVYPVAGADMTLPSYKDNANARPLNKAMMQWFVKQTFYSKEQAKDTRISLVDANLVGLEPTLVITAELDPLRSEGRLLAEKLKAAGVKVDAKDYEGVTHEFFGMGAVLPEAKAAEKLAAADLRRAFRRQAPQARTPARQR